MRLSRGLKFGVRTVINANTDVGETCNLIWSCQSHNLVLLLSALLSECWSDFNGELLTAISEQSCRSGCLRLLGPIRVWPSTKMVIQRLLIIRNGTLCVRVTTICLCQVSDVAAVYRNSRQRFLHPASVLSPPGSASLFQRWHHAPADGRLFPGRVIAERVDKQCGRLHVGLRLLRVRRDDLPETSVCPSRALWTDDRSHVRRRQCRQRLLDRPITASHVSIQLLLSKRSRGASSVYSKHAVASRALAAGTEASACWTCIEVCWTMRVINQDCAAIAVELCSES